MSTFGIVYLLLWIGLLELRLAWMRVEIRNARKVADFATSPCPKGGSRVWDGRKNEAGDVRGALPALEEGAEGRLRWPGWPAGPGQPQHPFEPPRVAAQVEDRAAKLRALGNAVSPPQAYEVGLWATGVLQREGVIRRSACP